MVLEFRLSQIGPQMVEPRIECLHAVPGAALKAGDKLLDLSVDLGPNFAQDCPPISFYRVIMREKAFLRAFHLAIGDPGKVGDLIAVFSTEPDEAVNQSPTREVRVAMAGIIHHSGMWTGNAI